MPCQNRSRDHQSTHLHSKKRGKLSLLTLHGRRSSGDPLTNKELTPRCVLFETVVGDVSATPCNLETVWNHIYNIHQNSCKSQELKVADMLYLFYFRYLDLRSRDFLCIAVIYYECRISSSLGGPSVCSSSLDKNGSRCHSLLASVLAQEAMLCILIENHFTGHSHGLNSQQKQKGTHIKQKETNSQRNFVAITRKCICYIWYRRFDSKIKAQRRLNTVVPTRVRTFLRKYMC
jgi:hypothetical protein